MIYTVVYSWLCNPYRYEVAPRDDGEDSGSGDEEEEEVRHYSIHIDSYIVQCRIHQ